MPGSQARIWGEKQRSLWDGAPSTWQEDLDLSVTHLDVQILTLVFQETGVLVREGKQSLSLSHGKKRTGATSAGGQHLRPSLLGVFAHLATSRVPISWSKVLPLSYQGV